MGATRTAVLQPDGELDVFDICAAELTQVLGEQGFKEIKQLAKLPAASPLPAVLWGICRRSFSWPHSGKAVFSPLVSCSRRNQATILPCRAPRKMRVIDNLVSAVSRAKRLVG